MLGALLHSMLHRRHMMLHRSARLDWLEVSDEVMCHITPRHCPADMSLVCSIRQSHQRSNSA